MAPLIKAAADPVIAVNSTRTSDISRLAVAMNSAIACSRNVLPTPPKSITSVDKLFEGQ